MGEAHGVECNGTLFNPPSAHKVAIHVIEYLVAIHITMEVRCRNRFRMVIEQPWDERTDDKTSSRKGLMHRGRLMDSPCYWFKILHIKRPREKIAIPSNYIKGMETVIITVLLVPVLNPNLKISLLIIGNQFFRRANIPLTIRAVFQ
jgi:hypothetical protein